MTHVIQFLPAQFKLPRLKWIDDMHCKCALECEYKIINLEQHVCHHNVCSLLNAKGPAVTVIWTVGWHWYWQLNEHPTAMHIHTPATARCSHRTSAPLYAMRKMLHLSTRAHCVECSRKNHCPALYSARIRVLWKSYETSLCTKRHIYCTYNRKKREIIMVRLKFILFLFPTRF